MITWKRFRIWFENLRSAKTVVELGSGTGAITRFIRERIGRGVDIVVHMRKRGTRRYVEEVVRVLGVEDGKYRLESLF